MFTSSLAIYGFIGLGVLFKVAPLILHILKTTIRSGFINQRGKPNSQNNYNLMF